MCAMGYHGMSIPVSLYHDVYQCCKLERAVPRSSA